MPTLVEEKETNGDRLIIFFLILLFVHGYGCV